MLGWGPAAEYFCCICEPLWVQSWREREKGKGEEETVKKWVCKVGMERGRNGRRGSKEARKGRRKKECLFHFDKYTEIRLLAHKKTIFVTFEEIPICVQPLWKAFLNGYTSFGSFKQCKSSPFLHLPTNTYRPSSVCFIISILTGVKECLIVVLMCISLIISYFEHFSLCSSHLHGFFENCLIKSFAHF